MKGQYWGLGDWFRGLFPGILAGVDQIEQLTFSGKIREGIFREKNKQRL